MRLRRMSSRSWLLVVLGIAVVAGFVVLGAIDQRMYDAGGPGIVRFEFVADQHAAARILTAWGTEGQDAARLSLWLDYPFAALYAAFLVLAIRGLGTALTSAGRPHLTWMAGWIWWLPVAGAVFDAIEDAALLAVLDGNISGALPAVATHAAVLKFSCLLPAIAYIISASASLIRSGRDSSARTQAA